MTGFTGYIAGFTFYTLAVIGIILLAFVVAKNCMVINLNKNNKNQFLSMETSLNIGTRKNLHIIKAGSERFLISTDPERTTFLTKLADECMAAADNTINTNSILAKEYNNLNNLNNLNNFETDEQLNGKQSIMKCLLNKINTI